METPSKANSSYRTISRIFNAFIARNAHRSNERLSLGAEVTEIAAPDGGTG
jgi:hypothetical protein